MNKIKYIPIILFLMFLSNVAHPKLTTKELRQYNTIFSYVDDLISKSRFHQLLKDSRVRFLKEIIFLNLHQPSSKKHFDSVLSKNSVNKGIRFMKRYPTLLRRAEKKYRISRFVLTSILYIETGFNLHVAKYRVFNVYASLMMADNPIYLNELWRKIKLKYDHLSNKQLRQKKKQLFKRAKKKKLWATKQLKSLFKVQRQIRRSLLSLKGSFAGAMGFPQFIPISYVNYGVDGNQDGRVDLYQLQDAVFSVAAYLKRSGFKRNNRSAKRKAVYLYNHSWHYVDTVLAYADKLKNASKKRG